MDPKVWSKLLTHHRRGHGVDVEALLINAPSGGAPEKAPRWDLTGTEGCVSGNRVFALYMMVWGYVAIYIGGRSTSVEQRGPPEGGGRAQGGRRAPCLPRWWLYIDSKSSGSRLFWKSRSRRFHSVWTPFDIIFLRNTEIGKKQQFGLGLQLIG